MPGSGTRIPEQSKPKIARCHLFLSRWKFFIHESVLHTQFLARPEILLNYQRSESRGNPRIYQFILCFLKRFIR